MASKSSMEHCLLSDIPDDPFQVILHQLASDDHATLRLVNRYVSQRATQFVSYIPLLLSESSSAEQLQQWYQFTRPLRHVVSVHVHIMGEVSAEVFELTVQQLIQHNSITELHLLGHVVSDDYRDNTALLPTLQPIKHILSHLQTLVIKDVTVKDLPAELMQLGAAAATVGGWPLQNMTLNANWNNHRCYVGRFWASPCLWPGFSAGVMQLTHAFPKLQTLVLEMPRVGVDPDVPAASDLCCSATADANEGPAALHAADVFGNWNQPLEFTEMDVKAQGASALVAALAGVVNAVLQLECLKVLSLTGVPDVWRPVQLMTSVAQSNSRVAQQVSALAVAAELAAAQASTAATDAAAAVTGVTCYPGQLWSVSAAAAELKTLDDYGCWLLQHHPALQALQVSCAHISSWSMAWEQQQQQSCRSSSSNALASEDAAVLVEARVDWHVDAGILRPNANSSAQADASDASNSNYNSDNNDNINSKERCDWESLSSAFLDHLLLYSSRPAVLWKGKLTSCHLCILSYQVEGLAHILGDLKSVKHLEVVVFPLLWPECNATSENQCAAIAAIKAAAVLPCLQSLCIDTGDGHQCMPFDLLLPLTAAKTRSSLQKLEFLGAFTHQSSSAMFGTGYDSGNSRWLRCLEQLEGVRELSIVKKVGDGYLYNIPAGDLPASLEVFRGKNLYLTDPGASAVPREGPLWQRMQHRRHCEDSSNQLTVPPAAIPDLQLQRLHLEGCHLSSHVHSILASRWLQYLTVINSSWSGGWAAATAAWPNVKELVWIKDDRFCSKEGTGISAHYGSSSIPMVETEKATEEGPSSSSPMDKAVDLFVAKLSAASSTAHRVLQDLASGFRNVQALTIKQQPWLNVDVFSKSLLQHVVHDMKSIKNIRFGVQQRTYDMQVLGYPFRRDLEEAYKAAVCRKLSNMTNNPDVGSDIRELQEWLHQQLPWTSVSCIKD